MSKKRSLPYGLILKYLKPCKNGLMMNFGVLTVRLNICCMRLCVKPAGSRIKLHLT